METVLSIRSQIRKMKKYRKLRMDLLSYKYNKYIDGYTQSYGEIQKSYTNTDIKDFLNDIEKLKNRKSKYE